MNVQFTALPKPVTLANEVLGSALAAGGLGLAACSIPMVFHKVCANDHPICTMPVNENPPRHQNIFVAIDVKMWRGGGGASGSPPVATQGRDSVARGRSFCPESRHPIGSTTRSSAASRRRPTSAAGLRYKKRLKRELSVALGFGGAFVVAWRGGGNVSRV